MNNTQTIKSENSMKEHKFNSGSVLSVLIKTALPIIILMVFNSAYAFIDSLLASSLVEYGTVGLDNTLLNGGTSMGLIFPLMQLLVSFEIMIAVGVGLAYSQSLAQNNPMEAKQRHNEAMSMIIYSGLIVFGVIVIFGLPYLITVSGNWHSGHWGEYTHEMIIDGYLYMVILGVSFIPMQLQQSYVRVLRAEGQGDIAALIPIATVPINLFFDWVFMGPANMGLLGAGLATFVAATSGLVFMWLFIISVGKKDKLTIKFELPKMKLHREVVIVILIFSMGSLLRRVFDSVTMITISTYIGNMDASGSVVSEVPKWTGSWTVITRSLNMAMMLSLGIAQAMALLISFYYNSDQADRVGKTMAYGGIMMFILTIASALLLFLIQEPLFFAYSSDGFGWNPNGPIRTAFIISLIYSIPLAMQPMCVMFYASTKQPKMTLIHTLVFNAIVILFATVGLILNQITGQPLYIYGFVAIGGFIGLIIVLFLFRHWYKKTMTNNI